MIDGRGGRSENAGRRNRGLQSVLGVFLLLLLGHAPALGDERTEMIARAKRATVLVDLGPRGSGSGFCVDAGGYFVTNAHVVAIAGFGGTVDLVVDASEPTQRTLRARVVSVDEENDLALLHAEGMDGAGAGAAAEKLTELGVDDKAGVVETEGVVSLGYPFGRMLRATGEEYPGASVNLARVSALRKSKGQLVAIQIDGAINPGHSGGPVLNEKGQVIGVVVSGIRGASVSLAISAGRVVEFLGRPAVTITVPEVRFSRRSEPVTFAVQPLPFGQKSAANDPVVSAMQLSLQAEGEEIRTLPLERVGDRFEAKVVLVPRDDSPIPLHVEVRHEGKVHQGIAADEPISVDGVLVPLSEIRMLARRPDRHIVAAVDGRKSASEVSGWERIKLSPPLPTDLSRAERIDVYRPAVRQKAFHYVITARRGEKVVGEWPGVIEIQDVPAGLDLEALRAYEKNAGSDTVRLARLKTERDALLKGLPEEIRQWEERLKTKPVEWQVAEVVDRKLASGGTAELQEDGSLVFLNATAARDTYVLRLRAPSGLPASKITAIRLEVLPDARFPEGGPGQHFGNFILNDMTAAASDGTEKGSTPIRLGRASADHSQPLGGISTRNWLVQDVIDSRPESGWAIRPRHAERHVAVFETVPPEPGKPIPTKQTDMVVRLVQDCKDNHTIGRLRLAVTDAPRPVFSDPLPEVAQGVLAIPSSKRTKEQEQVLVRLFIDSNQKLRSLEEEIASLEKAAHPLPLVEFLRDGDPYAVPIDTFELEFRLGGKATLHITGRGLQWEHHGGMKPGFPGENGPYLLVNGRRWQVNWFNAEDATGEDASAPYPLPLGPALWRHEVLAVTNEEDKKENRGRARIESKDERDRTEVLFEDNADGNGVYRIRFSAKR